MGRNRAGSLMTPRDALALAISESQAMTYDDDAVVAIRQRFRLDSWHSPRETAESRKGLCRDFAIYAIARTWTLCAGLPPPADLLLVCGHVSAHGQRDGTWHAWVELVPVTGPVLWAEATPGYRERVAEAYGAEFAGRIPRYAQRFDGEVFDEEFEYRVAGAPA